MAKYTSILFRLLVFATIFQAANSCKKADSLPASIIPSTCRISVVEGQNGSQTWRRDFYYDSFGNLTGSSYSVKTGTIQSLEQETYKYSADKYLLEKERKVNGTSTVYKYEYNTSNGMVRLITASDYQGKITGTEEFEYNGSTLKTYTVKQANGTVDTKYDYNGGVLSAVTSSAKSTTVANGKVTREQQYCCFPIYTREFDEFGQMKREEQRYPAFRFVYSYTYDRRLNYDQSRLRFRGIPDIDLMGRGEPSQNQATYVQEYFSLTSSDRTTTTVTYTHTYNNQNLSLGYTASNGSWQKNTYINCPK